MNPVEKIQAEIECERMERESEKVKYEVSVVFGKENMSIYQDGDGDYTDEEIEEIPERRLFNTREEAQAYIDGLRDGDGYLDIYVVGRSDIKEVEK